MSDPDDRVRMGAVSALGDIGPEANEAHRDHFHLDMKVRQSSHGVCH